MSVREVGTAEFHQLARRTEGKLVVAQFTATWCGPCRRIAPQYEALARRTPDVEFVKVYEHNSRDAIIAAGVRSFPTFHFYCGGAKVDECRGADIQGLEQKVNQHKGSARPAGGPVTVKLRFEREKRRQSGDGTILVAEEVELEVHASEGLEIFKFQVLSLTDIETNEQLLTTGDTNTPVDSDTSLMKALCSTGGGVYGNYPVLKVTKKVAGAAATAATGVGQKAASGGNASAKDAARDTVGTAKWDSCCSRTFFGRQAVLQPAYVIREESILPQSDLNDKQKQGKGPESILLVCKVCAENCFVPGRAKPSPAISVSVGFVCQSKEACGKGYGADLFSERADTGAEIYPPGSPALAAAEAAATAAADRVFDPTNNSPVLSGKEDGDMSLMRQRVTSGMKGVLAYEDTALQAKALGSLPPREGAGSIMEKGREMAAAGGFSDEEGLARALLSWFKKDFFTWTNKPACSGCGARGASMEPQGAGSPTPAEMVSQASRVEVYGCKECGMQTRFPRYNDPAKLLETRTGRCGEWANCFTLLCRAVGLEARHVVDWTDHVWTEVWIPARNCWVHADPCENKLDKPLMYERGWNKRLSYVIAYDRDGAVDVTRRYTRRWLQVLSRRNLVPEKWLAGVIASAGSQRAESRTALIAARLTDEQEQLKRYETMGDGGGTDSDEQEGRQSGDAEWVASRGEGSSLSASPGSDHLSSSSSPIPSPLIGAPLGVLQPRGGLALTIAAVVGEAGRGGASVLVGGATVSQADGRQTLCIAAVSGTTGMLLDSRGFTLRDSKDSSDSVVTWLAELPDGVIVAVAASGVPTGGDSSHKGLEQAIRVLVGDSTDQSKSEELLTSQDIGGGNSSWTLVGWKGPGEQKWARRQHGSASDGKKSRCELFVELIVPPLKPPPAIADDEAIDRLSNLTQIELKNRLCVNPLRSIQGLAETSGAAIPSLRGSTTPPASVVAEEEPSFPARGVCFKDGEPTVIVGPSVELVDCKGWTTVLQAPAEREGSRVGEGAGDSPRDPLAWRVTSVSAAVGGWHDDTERFDDAVVGCPGFIMGGSPVPLSHEALFLPLGRVKEIVGWSGDCVNGVQVVYDVGGIAVRGPKHLGEHGLYRQSRIVLDLAGGEVVTEITVMAGSLLDSLRVRTSTGREQKWGGNGGEHTRTWHVADGQAFVGFHGGMGGHIHCLGVTLAEQGAVGNAGGLEVDQTIARSPRGDQSLTPSNIATGLLYNTDHVRRACAQLLLFNALSSRTFSEGEAQTKKTDPKGDTNDDDATARVPAPENELTFPTEEIITALETARKYADNLLASPLDPRVSRIRLGNGFFNRKIGKLAGGGALVRAMGFRLTVDEEGRMQYVFRRGGAAGGLEGLRHARQTLTDVVSSLKRPVV